MQREVGGERKVNSIKCPAYKTQLIMLWAIHFSGVPPLPPVGCTGGVYHMPACSGSCVAVNHSFFILHDQCK